MNIETRKLTVNITENTAADAARIRELIDKLEQDHSLTRSELTELIRGRSPETAVHLFERARNVRIHHYGLDMYSRGLTMFTNYSRNDCYYLGIRKSNPNAERYRLSKEMILHSWQHGNELGFCTFLPQDGAHVW